MNNYNFVGMDALDRTTVTLRLEREGVGPGGIGGGSFGNQSMLRNISRNIATPQRRHGSHPTGIESAYSNSNLTNMLGMNDQLCQYLFD